MRSTWGALLVGIVLIAAAVVLCPDAGQAGEFNWKQAQGTEIRLLALRAWFTDHWKANLPEFEKLTGIKVVVEDYPEDPFRQKLAVEMSAKSKGVDVFTTGTMREGRQFFTSGWYGDLTSLVNDPSATSAEWDRNDFIDAVWKAHQFDGKQVAVPVQAERPAPLLPQGPFRRGRAEATQDAGRAGGRGQEAAQPAVRVRLRGPRTEDPGAVHLVPLALRQRRELAESGRKAGINTPAALNAVNQYVRLLRTYGDPGITDNGPMEVQTHFLQGRAAMILDAVSWAGLFSDPQKSKVAGKWEGALAPPGPAGVTYELWAWSLAMSPFSEKQKAAWLFMQWATSKEIQKPLHLRSFPMPRKSLWTDPEWKSKVLPGYYEAAMTQVQSARPIGHPPFVASPEITDIVGIAINNALAGKDAKAEMEAAAKKMARRPGEDRAEAVGRC